MIIEYRQTLNFLDDDIKHNLHYIFSIYGVPDKIIEVGTFEGLTSCYISDVYCHVGPIKIWCIDPHEPSDDLSTNMSLIKENFLHNINLCKNKDIEYLCKKSWDGLLDLLNKGVCAQFVYIDGDHRSPYVLEDLVLAFNLLPIGGIILCDDINWVNSKNDKIPDSPSLAPRLAIENFMQCNWHRIRLIDLPRGHQTAFQKINN